jgi:hypothetical protein
MSSAGSNRKHGESGKFLGLILLTLFLLSSTGEVFAQQLGQGSDDGISLWRVFAALIVCVGVAVAAAFVLKHRMQGGMPLIRPNRNRARLAVIESLRLRPQVDLCIVSCDGDEFLMVISPQGAHLLHAPAVRVGQAGGACPP